MRADLNEAWEHPFGRNEYFLGALIGGIFARNDAKKAAKKAEEAAKIPMVTTTDHVVDLLGMNKAAIEAGYNPMTLLNAGGLSAFTKTTNTTTGHNAMAAAQAAGAVPSMGSVFANAFAGTIDSLAGSVFKSVIPEAPLSKDYFPPAPSSGMGMAEAMGWNTLAKTAGGARTKSGAQVLAGVVPTKALPGGGSNPNPFSREYGPPIPAGLGSPRTPEHEVPTVTNPFDRANVDPTVRDANAYENRYADPGSAAAAPYIAYNDYLYNKTGLTARERAVAPGPLSTERQVGKDAWLLWKNGDVANMLKYGMMTFDAANSRLTAPARQQGPRLPQYGIARPNSPMGRAIARQRNAPAYAPKKAMTGGGSGW